MRVTLYSWCPVCRAAKPMIALEEAAAASGVASSRLNEPPGLNGANGLHSSSSGLRAASELSGRTAAAGLNGSASGTTDKSLQTWLSVNKLHTKTLSNGHIVVCKDSLPKSEANGAANPRVDPRVTLALKAISEQYFDPELSLGKLAKEINLSVWYLARIFKESTGLGFRNYLRRTRMMRAEELLLRTFMSIKEISIRVGYKHVSDFDHHFKADYGKRPTEYRDTRRSIPKEQPLVVSARNSNK
ncbi:MAG TPA: AraC family transcriptional regulator [Blastocatellia bacterium]|nr:AraC family transcriptional regulator [Blastocatellia bacterium]